VPTKVFDDSTGRCRVEFRLPPEAAAQQAWLAGDFNDWSLDACPLARRDDGSLAVELELEPGRSYRFRYYLGDGEWENDWAADAYVDNDHGGADSVVAVPPAPSEPPPVGKPEKAGTKPAKKAAAKKAAAKKAGAKADGVRARKAPPPPRA
jgi:1,4-alpha-glucan branching enzyme